MWLVCVRACSIHNTERRPQNKSRYATESKHCLCENLQQQHYTAAESSPAYSHSVSTHFSFHMMLNTNRGTLSHHSIQTHCMVTCWSPLQISELCNSVSLAEFWFPLVCLTPHDFTGTHREITWHMQNTLIELNQHAHLQHVSSMLTAAVCDVFCDRRKTEQKRHLSRESTSCHPVREGSGLPPGPPVSLSLFCAPSRLMLWILVLLAPLLPVSLHHVCPLSLSPLFWSFLSKCISPSHPLS